MANISNLFNFASLPQLEVEKKNIDSKLNQEITESKVNEPIIASNNSQADSNIEAHVQKPNINPTNTSKSGLLRSTNIVISAKSTPIINGDAFQNIIVGKRKTPFTKADLQHKWDEFLLKLEADERYGEIVWLKRTFELENTKIHLFVDNALQKSMLVEDGHLDEFVHFLRDSLKNDEIKIIVEVSDEVEEKKMIYTQAEKYNFLAEKNPSLHILKTALGLDYDY